MFPALPVAAQAPRGVPARHWAAPSVKRLAAKGILTGQADGQFHGNQPVTRYELAVALDRLVRYIEAGRKPLSPGPARSGYALPARANPVTRAALGHLAANGFISPQSPLLHANKIVKASELTEILSQVTIRLSDRSLPPTTH